MKLLVGLGNPGPRYADTRHNVGFRVVERFAERNGIALSQQRFSGRFGRGRCGSVDVALLEPETFMNRSGESVRQALGMLPLADVATDLVVVFDDLDLPFGQLRLRKAGSSGGHRGIQDIIDRLGGGGFPRLRFGIGRPPADADPVAYVLSGFGAEERRGLRGAVEAAAEALEWIVADGVEMAMNRVNQLRSGAEPPEEGSPKDPAPE